MEVVFLYLLFCICATIISAFVLRATPYFPIEISRCAASHSISQQCLTFGALTAPLVYFLTSNTPSLLAYAAFGGLIVLSLFNDVAFFLIHNFGVFMIFLAAVMQVVVSGQHFLNLFSALVILGLRLASKLTAMIFLENRRLSEAMHYAKQIMIFRAAPRHSATLLVFRICGALQWLSFLLLAQIFF
jgi:hypothetical protein